MSPLWHREMLREARRPANAWLRVLGCAFALAWLLLGWGQLRGANGLPLFLQLNAVLLVILFTLGPVATSDSISRERREGTLPLLFLTDLKAGEVAASKAVAQCLRLSSLWASALPVLLVPVLAGGVGWMDLVRASILQTAVIILMPILGLWISSHCRDLRVATGLAALTGFVGLLAALLGNGALRVALSLWSARLWPGWETTCTLLRNQVLERLWLLPFFAMDDKAALTVAGSSVPNPATPADGVSIAVGLAGLAGAVGLALVLLRQVATRLPALAREDGLRASHTVGWWTRIRWAEAHNHWRRRWLRRNPFLWLSGGRFQFRLWTWLILLVVVSIEATLMTWSWEWYEVIDAQKLLHTALCVAISIEAGGGMTRSEQAEWVELVSVTPAGLPALIRARLLGAWLRLLMPAVFLVWVWIRELPGFPSGDISLGDSETLECALRLVGLFLVPLFSITMSCRSGRPWIGMLAGWTAGWLVPFALVRLVVLMQLGRGRIDFMPLQVAGLSVTTWLACAWGAWSMLKRWDGERSTPGPPPLTGGVPTLRLRKGGA